MCTKINVFTRLILILLFGHKKAKKGKSHLYSKHKLQQLELTSGLLSKRKMTGSAYLNETPPKASCLLTFYISRFWLWDGKEKKAHNWHLIVRREVKSPGNLKYKPE